MMTGLTPHTPTKIEGYEPADVNLTLGHEMADIRVGSASDNIRRILFSRIQPDGGDLEKITKLQANNTREKVLAADNTLAGGFLSLQSSVDFMSEHLDFERSTVINEAVDSPQGYVKGRVLGYLIGMPLNRATIDNHYYTKSYAKKCLAHVNSRIVSTRFKMSEVLVGQIFLEPELRGMRVHGVKKNEGGEEHQVYGELVQERTDGAHRLASKLYRSAHIPQQQNRKLWMARVKGENVRSINFHSKAFRLQGVVPYSKAEWGKIYGQTQPYPGKGHQEGDFIFTRDLTREFPNEDQK